VTCRMLGFSTQAFYKWRAKPVCDRDYDDAHLINAAADVHHDDPEFGYRFVTDELTAQGWTASRNRVNRLCTIQRLWSVHARRAGRYRRPGPPVHDDLVGREFTAAQPNQLWFTDITEHPTAEGKLYLCAVKDACSKRIVSYSIDARMTSQLAVDALRNAIVLRDPKATAIVHSDRGSAGSSDHTPTSAFSARHSFVGRWGGSGPAPATPRWSRSSACCRRTCSTGAAGPPARSSVA
jgi:putative transposase